MNTVLNDYLREKESLFEDFKLIQEELETVLGPLRELLEKVEKETKPFREALDKTIKLINDSVLNDDDKKHLENVALMLVKKQIIITPEEGSFYFYDFKPTKRSIFKLYNSYSQGERFDNLINTILETENVNKQFVKEAVKCFKKKYYLACASLMLSAIDSYFISTKSDSKGKKLNLNAKLTSELITEIRSNRSFEYFFLIQTNALLMLGRIYSQGKNFENEPDSLNRNYVHHGMSERKLTKIDCIKLFILCSYLELIV